MGAAPWRTGAGRGHDGSMWTLITLLWRIMTRLMRRLGMGALLVPVSAMGMALAGVHVWTVALVLIALAVVFRKPLLAAALVPISMISAGLAGLVVAAMTPGGSVDYFVHAVLAKPQEWVTVSVLPSATMPAGKAGHPVSWAVTKVPAARWYPGPHQAKLSILAQYVHAKIAAPLYAVAFGVTKAAPGWWQGRLLVLVALLLLTLGLWLAPRMLCGLRPRMAARMPELRRWLATNRWALLLPVVVAIGMAAFGARPWTVAAVIAALIIVIRWPVIAADLVPVALGLLAAYGFAIAANWQDAPGMYPHAMFYGMVWVDGPKSAIAAGAEASAFLAFGAWLVPRTIGAHLRTVFVRVPDTDLAGRVQRLTETRGHAVDAAAAELRRIERDLHDGAQARLVALGMNLRAVERVLPGSPNAALALVAEARETSVRALNELRDLIRGICPPVLADRGLGHAVQALVLDTPLPITLEIDLPGRPTPPVESACYFAIAEALANAVKHAGARSAHIRIRHSAGLLRIEVSDDGIGGADPALGTGLLGVERRLGTFDGILAVNSPPGGPTMVVMEVPCALSSRKTCSC
jgi:signal transduction histidine kinase